ncbi:MAG: discoidin domain-containing protein, partial [Longicatena sp.]|nr:discoidin domain-containing protein [Longicatena sp.]
YMTARYARLVALNNSNGSDEFLVREFEVYGISNAVNIALGKNVSSTNADGGTSPDCITDGDLSAHWDGGEASEENPQSFTVDLGVAAFINAMKAYPYTGGRWYDYNIEVSADGLAWTPVANRKDTHGTVTAFAGEAYRFETPVYGRFVRVNMTFNSANPSVHMREFEIFGEFDPEYIAPTTDLLDPENVAFGKPVHSHLDSSSLSTVVDGFDETACSGAFAPAYFDIDLEENYDISDIELKFPEKKGRYYYFSVYGSTDATNYDRLYQERSQVLPEKGKYNIDLSELENSTYRIVRVFVELVSDAKNAVLSEVRVHGQATGENKEQVLHDYTKEDADKAGINAVETILDMKAFDDTEYAAPITEAEVIENVYGIIDRIIGAKY